MKLMYGLFVAILFAPLTAIGGWTSAGGDLQTDRLNPWWLENTVSVRYCIAVDNDTFTASPDDLDRSFRAAVDYWRGQFHGRVNKYNARIASQAFERVNCTAPQIDLEILAGPGALSAEQAGALAPRLDTVVGVAVLTDYDRRLLRGHGFIYLAADAQLTWHPWGDKRRLQRLLTHELGHVFGVPHIRHTVMDETLPDQLMRIQSTQSWDELVDLAVGPHYAMQFCPWQGSGLFFTQQKKTSNPNGSLERCIRITPTPTSSGEPSYEIFDLETGEKFGDLSPKDLVEEQSEYPVQVRLTEAQTVFPSNAGAQVAGNLVLYTRSHMFTYVHSSGWSKTVKLEISPTRQAVIGFWIEQNAVRARVLYEHFPGRR